MSQGSFKPPSGPQSAAMSNQPWKGLTGVALHAVVVCAVALSLPILENPSATLLLGGILCTLTYLVLGVREGWSAPLWFSPLSYYFLWYAIGLGLSAIYYGTVTASGDSVPFSIVMVPPDDLAAGYVIYLIGSVALHTGLQLFRPIGPDDKGANELYLGTGRLGQLIVLWAAGLCVLWNPAWIAPLGGPGRILQWVSLAALSSFVLTPREYWRLSRTAFSSVLVVGTAGLFAANLMSGSKAYLMLSFLPIVWLFIVRRPLHRWLPIVGMALLVFYLTIVAPVVMASRYIPVGEGENPVFPLVETFLDWRTILPDSIDSSFYNEQVERLLTRQFDPAPVAYLHGEVRRHGLQLGATMAYAAYAFIPRILWSDKPGVSRGAWFTTYIGFAKSEEEATTSTGMTATGELYWNFGTIGVLIGMFIIGCLLGGLWRMAGADPRQKPLHMLLYVLLTLSMPAMSEAVSVFVAIVVNFVMFTAAFIILGMLHRSGAESHVAIAS